MSREGWVEVASGQEMRRRTVVAESCGEGRGNCSEIARQSPCQLRLETKLRLADSCNAHGRWVSSSSWSTKASCSRACGGRAGCSGGTRTWLRGVDPTGALLLLLLLVGEGRSDADGGVDCTLQGLCSRGRP